MSHILVEFEDESFDIVEKSKVMVADPNDHIEKDKIYFVNYSGKMVKGKVKFLGDKKAAEQKLESVSDYRQIPEPQKIRKTKKTKSSTSDHIKSPFDDVNESQKTELSIALSEKTKTVVSDSNKPKSSEQAMNEESDRSDLTRKINDLEEKLKERGLYITTLKNDLTKQRDETKQRDKKIIELEGKVSTLKEIIGNENIISSNKLISL